LNARQGNRLPLSAGFSHYPNIFNIRSQDEARVLIDKGIALGLKNAVFIAVDNTRRFDLAAEPAVRKYFRYLTLIGPTINATQKLAGCRPDKRSASGNHLLAAAICCRFGLRRNRQQNVLAAGYHRNGQGSLVPGKNA